jgi:hypothetical protein
MLMDGPEAAFLYFLAGERAQSRDGSADKFSIAWARPRRKKPSGRHTGMRLVPC